ncbi:MAG: MBL fold metallo-hydrolase [Planctomycetota bacterium]
MHHDRTPSSGLSRRCFLGSAAAVAALASLPGAALAVTRRAGTSPLSFTELAPGAFLIDGGGGNGLLHDGVLIDCKNPGLGDHLRREVLARGELRTVVNTHHHADHTGGNHGFRAPDQGSPVEVVAHVNAAPRIEAQIDRYRETVRGMAQQGTGDVPDDLKADIERIVADLDQLDAADFLPSRTIEAATDRIGPFDVFHFGPGHTDNDLVLFDPEANVLHAGDLLFHKVYPFFDGGAGANTDGWINACNRLHELCDADTVVIPGHGAVADRTIAMEQIAFFERLREAVGEAIREGRSRDEAIEMTWPFMEGYQVDWIRPYTIGGVYDELSS